MKVEKPKNFLTEKFSFSKLQCFSQCPRKAFYRYVLKKRQPGTWMLRGRAVHAGQEYDGKERLEGRRPKRTDVLDCAVATFEKEMEENELEAPVDHFSEEHDTQLKVYWESGERDRLHPAPRTEERPEGSIEVPFEIELHVKDGDEWVPVVFEGFLDMLAQTAEDEPLRVVDFKSTKRAIGRDEGEKNLQIAVYQLGSDAEAASIVSFVGAGRQKSTTKVADIGGLTQTKMQRLLVWMADSAVQFREAVRSGDFPKCSLNCHWCSESACEFFDMCYPRDSATISKFVKVGDIKPVGTLPQPEWRK